MRFAYIDSQGNEVPIPSIDALALRIELGAVGPDTQLYDAQADHWGPAHTHEIFHTLSRDSEGDGFVAPPPPVAAPPPAATEPVAEEAAAPEVEEAEPEEEEEEEEAASDDVDLGLTLADPLPEPEAPVDADEDDERPLGDIAMEEASMDLPLLEDPEPEPEEEPEPEPEEPAEEPAGGGFDFGDLGAGLELEEAPDEDEEEAAADLAGGMGVEREMEFASPAADVGGGGDDLELETPMSAFQPEAPPDWMEDQGGEQASDDILDFSAVTAEEEATQETVAPVSEAPVRERRTPKDRPSPPKFKRQRSMSGPIVFVVLLLAVGVGGYVGWPILQQWLEERNAPARPPVVMPTIPAELMPQMREIGEAAIADVVGAVDQETRPADTPDEPDDDWLAGVYLANASQYDHIEAFWVGVEAFLEGLRAAEWQRYHDAYVERAEADGLAPEAAAQVTERADSGFVAAQPDREEAYGQLERLVDAALGLHDFLLQNEDDIVYRPGVTSANDPNVDPVLEIVAPAAQRDQMLESFDEITGALNALGSLDRVTRDRLVAAMTARLQQVGLQ